MEILVDGVKYTPANQQSPNIGVAITTHNRPDVLTEALKHQLQYLPANSKLVVVDDGSTPPAVVPGGIELVRIEHSIGIPGAKNRCFEALEGCEHLFLFDDDAWPIADGWWKPYAESPEPHLSYQFLDLKRPPLLHDISMIYQDDKHVAYTGQRGVMLYYHRSTIEKVGGFDPVYGRGMYEHSDLANRIYNAGLTSWRYADIVDSNKLIYSLDEESAVKRTVPRQDRETLVRHNVGIHNKRRDEGYVAFVEYRQPVDTVITTLLTSQPDPQRGRHMAADSDALSVWAKSIKGAKAIVLADELQDSPDGTELIHVPAVAGNPYYLRWLYIYQYLRAHREIRRVWCTDGTDVEMLHEPWGGMEPGRVYLGSEPKTLDDKWMRENHKASIFQDFISTHKGCTMLNAGLLGGSRADAVDFAHRMVSVADDLFSSRFWKKETAPVEIGDMAAFNLVAYTYFKDRIVTGPLVHSVFKANERSPYAWWRHK